MRHFAHLRQRDRLRLFERPPEPFTRDAPVPELAEALGATLYMPGTRPALAADLARQGRRGVVSAVVCLEDAVPDDAVPAAEANVARQLRDLAGQVRPSRQGTGDHGDPDDGGEDGPLVFIRVRSPEQVTTLVQALGDALPVLSGFVLPKFTARTGPAFLEAVTEASSVTGQRLLVMPVLESPEVMHRETRDDALLGIRALLEEHRSRVLAVRLGATDLCGLFGIRRDRDLTIYDVRVVADLVSDVVNVLARADGTGHVVTGPVWEYFPGHERLFKPQLRSSPFEEHDAGRLRHRLLDHDLDALIREVVLDRSNGLLGKTVIHPAHVTAVHALSVVTHEEHSDATDVLGNGGGGVAASRYGNKMNEARPHRAWAERTLRRARAFGVAAEDVGLVDLLAAGAPE